MHCALETAVRIRIWIIYVWRAESKDLGIWDLGLWVFRFFLSFWKGLSVVGWLSVGLTLVMQMPFKGKPAKSGSRVLFLFWNVSKRYRANSTERLSSLAGGLLGWRHNAALTTFAIAFRHCKSRTGSRIYSHRYRDTDKYYSQIQIEHREIHLRLQILWPGKRIL